MTISDLEAFNRTGIEQQLVALAETCARLGMHFHSQVSFGPDADGLCHTFTAQSVRAEGEARPE